MNEMTKKKKQRTPLLFVTLMVIGVCLLIGGMVVLAAAVTREEKANLFQIGNLESKIIETFEEPVKIGPNQTVRKVVKIENNGTLPQFIRVMVQPVIQVKVAGETIERLLPSQIGKELIFDFDTVHWKQGEDGYYYYLDALTSEKQTESLFNEVKLADVAEDYQKAQMRLQLKVESLSTRSGYQDVWWSGNAPSGGALAEIDRILATKIN